MKKRRKKIARVFLVIIIVFITVIAAFKVKERIHVNKIMKVHEIELPIDTTNAVIQSDSDSEHITTSVQQIMIGSLCNDYDDALQTLLNLKAAGYESIELNDFMVQKTALVVKVMTKFAGMPIGNGGNLDWNKLIEESGLTVSSLHSNLGTLESDLDSVVEMANSFGTDTIVITGMYRFDYDDLEEVKDLASRLNQVGKNLAEEGIQLLYHNHNCELQKVTSDKTAFDIIVEDTDPEYVNFEFDSYWMTVGGANTTEMMAKLGDRMKMWHINDRGCVQSGPYMTPILDEDATELGNGNMDLDALSKIAKENGITTVVLETHQNWVNDDPIESIWVSAQYLQEQFGN